MDRRYSLDEVLERLERRASGAPEALDGVWAEHTVSWRSYNGAETRMTGEQRAALARSELEGFRRAMPDFTRQSVFHRSDRTDTVVELSTWAGTSVIGPVQVEVCLVYTVVEGRIARIAMYADSSQLLTLHRAVESSSSPADRS